MKIILRLTLFLVSFTIAIAATCQKQGAKTIILIRHAEKATATMTNDPALSDVGKARAASLQSVLKKYKPEIFYSTNFIRTKETVVPWANALGKKIESYDPKDQPAFSQTLKNGAAKTIVVVGHSNTIPALVNLLASTKEYQDLPDSVYNKIFILTLKKDGSAKVQVREY